MYLGEHFHKVDSKGRVSMPSEFRSMSDGKYFVTYGVDRCLYVYDESGFRAQAAVVFKLDDSKDEARALKRVFFRATPQNCDGPGRILLSARQQEHAGIKKDVVVVGMNDHIEIWSQEDWDRQQQQDLANYHGNVAKMPTLVRTWITMDQLPPPTPHAPAAPAQERNEGA